jgi:hypothetical protein
MLLRGVFLRRRSLLDYEFVCLETDEIYVLSAWFEPVFEVIVYSMRCTTLFGNKSKVQEVVDTAPLEWGKRVCDSVFYGGYVPGETFLEFLLKKKANGEFNPRDSGALAWILWPKLLFLADLYGTSLEDYDFFHFATTKLVASNDPEVIVKRYTSWTIHAEVLRTLKGASKDFCDEIAIFEEVKSGMCRAQEPLIGCRYVLRAFENVDDVDGKLLEREDMYVYSRDAEGKVNKIGIRPLELNEGNDLAVLQAYEPADFEIMTGIPWMRQSATEAATVDCKFSNITHFNKNKYGPRLRLDTKGFDFDAVKQLIDKTESHKILCIFDRQQISSNQAFYEVTDLGNEMRLVLHKETKVPSLVLAKPRSTDMWYVFEQGDCTNHSLIVDTVTLMKDYRPMQTCLLRELYLMKDIIPTLHLVLFFSSVGTPKRWTRYLHKICGPEMRLCVVGELGAMDVLTEGFGNLATMGDD